jgi:hypothetical protein
MELAERIVARKEEGATIVSFDGVDMVGISEQPPVWLGTDKPVVWTHEDNVNHAMSLIGSTVQVLDGTHPALNLT